MIQKALPNAKRHPVVGRIYGIENATRLERIRAFRKVYRRRWKQHRAFTLERTWDKIAGSLQHDDIVAGHFSISEIRLTGFQSKLITILRHPVYRLLSEYNYGRVGYQRRPALRRLLHRGRLAAAGEYSFEDYIHFLRDNNIERSRFLQHYLIGNNRPDDAVDFMDKNYFLYGTIEGFDRFVEQFNDLTGLNASPVTTNVTQNKARPTLNSREISLAERFCESDLNFYFQVTSEI
jgi:hypothetical protein